MYGHGTLLQHILTRSLHPCLPDPVQRAHATHWLSWIARHMGTNRDLRWGGIPTWTPAATHNRGRACGRAGNGACEWIGIRADIRAGLRARLGYAAGCGGGDLGAAAQAGAVMPLLQTALHKQVLRQAGAVYQFRHAAL
jgi:hypothetical protein